MELDDVREHRGYRIAIGVGLVSYGLIHLVIAWLAAQIALGGKGDASQTGALAELAGNPLGVGLLWVMAVGLFVLAVWQGLEASIGPADAPPDRRLKRRVASAGRSVVYLALGVATIGVALGSRSRSGQSEETLSARLLDLPFGVVLVVAVGLAVAGVGVAQVVKGVKRNFLEDLDSGVSTGVQRMAVAGYCAKGVAFVIIGALFGWAAVTYDPDKAGGLDAALTTISKQPFGTGLLLVMAAGIACFGIYCFVWARKARN